jgi:hypothetical protein
MGCVRAERWALARGRARTRGAGHGRFIGTETAGAAKAMRIGSEWRQKPEMGT